MIFYEVSFIVSPERKILKKFESRKKAETYLMEIMKHVNMTNVKIEKIIYDGWRTNQSKASIV